MASRRTLDKIDNISAYDYYAFYLRNSRFFGVIWFFMSICFALCLILVFTAPNWIGDTLQSSNRGYFGLYRFCTRNDLLNAYNCFGTWTDFSTLPNSAAIKSACFFVGFACLLSIVCVIFSLLCVFVEFERVFHVCGWIQLICTICLLTGLCVYPVGWNSSVIRSVCGNEANQFKLATCALRWPYILACISFLLAFLLTMFAFLLAARQAKFILSSSSNQNNCYGNIIENTRQITQQSFNR